MNKLFMPGTIIISKDLMLSNSICSWLILSLVDEGAEIYLCIFSSVHGGYEVLHSSLYSLRGSPYFKIYEP